MHHRPIGNDATTTLTSKDATIMYFEENFYSKYVNGHRPHPHQEDITQGTN
jgi:hypothetical protein